MSSTVKNVLFVCELGVARSPNAAYKFNMLADEKKISEVVLATSVGIKKPARVADALKQDPISVFVFENWMKRDLLQNHPSIERKLFEMSKFAGQDGDVEDLARTQKLIPIIFEKMHRAIVPGETLARRVRDLKTYLKQMGEQVKASQHVDPAQNAKSTDHHAGIIAFSANALNSALFPGFSESCRGLAQRIRLRNLNNIEDSVDRIVASFLIGLENARMEAAAAARADLDAQNKQAPATAEIVPGTVPLHLPTTADDPKTLA